MWTRVELKERARMALKSYYWYGVLVCFLAGILQGGNSRTGLSVFQSRVNTVTVPDVRLDQYNSMFHLRSPIASMASMTVAAVAVILVLVILVTAILFSTFVGSVIVIGKMNYFLVSRSQGRSAGVGMLFSAFTEGHYLNIVKIMFFKSLYELLWSLLLIVPGIYKSFEYQMIPYLLAEDPAIDIHDAFRISKEMMDGNKFAAFVLQLSFLGWMLLGALACGIGMVFVAPYVEATMAELYLRLNPRSRFHYVVS